MKIPNQSNVTYNAVIPGKPGTPGSLTSNTVNTEVLSYSISKVSSCDKTLATAGETVHNTVTITNNSSTKLSNAFISNPTPEGASYVVGSVKVNGIQDPTRSMTNGFSIPDLNPGESITIEYDIQINNPVTVTCITDTSEFQYAVNDPVRGDVNFTEYTDPISIDIVNAKLSVQKTVDKTFAVKGDILTYAITIGNDGNVDINDIYFTDSIPKGTTFVEKSVFVNDISYPAYNPEIGYSIVNIPPAGIVTTIFQVKIN